MNSINFILAKKIKYFILLTAALFALCANSLAGIPQETREYAIKLFSEMIAKLESNSKFTIEDDVKFFGEIPNPNPTTQFYINKGYISLSEELSKDSIAIKRKLPKYSFYGELLRINSPKFIKNTPPKLFYVSESYSVHGGRTDSIDFILTVFMSTNGKVFHMNYDVNKKILLAPLYINGTSILYELGISKKPFQDSIAESYEAEMEDYLNNPLEEKSKKSLPNESDIADKQNNEKILNSLLSINSSYKGAAPAVSDECKREIIKILSNYDNPLEVARLMVLSNYMIRALDSPNRISNIFSAITEGFGMQRLKALKTHQDFTEAMLFIKNSIKLDAGISYKFSEIIWEARDIENVKKHFRKEIIKWADGIRQHGTKTDREILRKYESENPDLFQ